jgi:hypothetical protein
MLAPRGKLCVLCNPPKKLTSDWLIKHYAMKTYGGGGGKALPFLTSSLDRTVHKNHFYVIFLCTFSVNWVDCTTTHSTADVVLMSMKVNIKRVTIATDLGASTCTNLFALCMKLYSHERARHCIQTAVIGT